MNKLKQFFLKYFVRQTCDICGEKKFFLDSVDGLMVCDSPDCEHEIQKRHEKDLGEFLPRKCPFS